MEQLLADLTAPVTAFASEHAGFAGPIVLAVCLLESLVIVGAFIPSTLLLIGLGGLAAAGIVDLATLAAWGIAGAGIGFWASYLVGSIYGAEIESLPWLVRRPELLARGHRFFRRWGALAVLVSRFVGPARAIVPLLAGTLGVRPFAFHLASWTSAVIWVPAALAPATIGTWLAAEMADLPPSVRMSISVAMIFAVYLAIRALRGRG